MYLGQLLFVFYNCHCILVCFTKVVKNLSENPLQLVIIVLSNHHIWYIVVYTYLIPKHNEMSLNKKHYNYIILLQG